MIASREEYDRTRTFIEGLQALLLQMRGVYTAEQYAELSRPVIRDLARAQREVTMFFATPAGEP